MRILLICCGFICVALGFIGAFLPLIPTVPFILLAAFFFSKSSPRIYQWLINIPAFGEMIEQWNEHGSVSIKGKVASATAIGAVIIYHAFFSDLALELKLLISAILLSVVAYVLSRPLPPREAE